MSKAKEYKIEIRINDKLYQETVKCNYTNDTWKECEEMIHDVFNQIANKFINKEWYSE